MTNPQQTEGLTVRWEPSKDAAYEGELSGFLGDVHVSDLYERASGVFRASVGSGPAFYQSIRGETKEQVQIEAERALSEHFAKYGLVQDQSSLIKVLTEKISDEQRMDWLVMQHVEVRTPLRYGSRADFVTSTKDDDGEELPSDLRSLIDGRLNSRGRADG